MTAHQVKDLQEAGETELIEELMGVPKNPELLKEQETVRPEFKTPSERLFFDVENANWVAVGDTSACDL